MIIKKFPSGPLETNAYVVACPVTKKAAIIDPAAESFGPITEYIYQQQLIPEKILLTHSHWDHTAEAFLFKKNLHLPLFVHEDDRGNVERPGSDGLPCWISIEGVSVDGFLTEEIPLLIGDLTFQVIHTPGHTPGGICFYCEKWNVLFSGDTLFKGSIGNLSFPTARPSLMWESLNKLAQLPLHTKVFSGHGLETTIGTESWLKNAESIFGNSY